MEPGVLRSGSEQRDSVVEELDVDALRRQLLARSFPRLQMMLLLALAGFGAFVSSLAMLHGGITSMPARYFIAAALGYLIFLALVRAWLAYQRRRWVIDLADLPVDVPLGGGPDAPPLFTGQGGSFGGGGASGHFSLVDAPGAAPITPPAELPRASSALLDGIPDADDAWPIVVVVFVALGALVALAFVVWASPALFAEVLLDAAVVGAVYRRVRQRPRGHWLRGVLRRTWLPATALCALVSVAGCALEVAAPGAHSVRAVAAARNTGR
jgi:hypothetical protein